jgi:xylulose-5-phosphate/fructose-6-phosphate phosphoketolase
MPGEVIDQPNPPALESHLPSEVDVLFVKIEKKPLADDVKIALQKWQRAANYIAAGMTLLDVLIMTLTFVSYDLFTR